MQTGPLFNSRKPLSREKQAEADRLMDQIFGKQSQEKNPAPEKTKGQPTPVR